METPIDRSTEREIEKMNTDFTASNVVDNFDAKDYLEIATWAAVSGIFAGSCRTTPRVIRGVPNVVTGGLVGLYFGYLCVYVPTAVRLGFYKN